MHNCFKCRVPVPAGSPLVYFAFKTLEEKHSLNDTSKTHYELPPKINKTFVLHFENPYFIKVQLIYCY